MNFPNMIEKKMRKSLREKRQEEKSGPFDQAEEPKQHELDEERNQNDGGDVSIFDATGADLPQDSIMPGSANAAAAEIPAEEDVLSPEYLIARRK